VFVPLFIKLPGNLHGSETFDLPAQGIDVMPTVLDVLGIDAELPYQLRGDPLFLQGGQALNTALGSRPVVLEFEHIDAEIGDQCALVMEDFKVIQYQWEGRMELYDLATDPLEQTNLAEQEKDKLEQLYTLMLEYTEAHLGRRFADVDNPALSQKLKDELRALGYVD
jgi:arylsulfatase A-like enzyme